MLWKALALVMLICLPAVRHCQAQEETDEKPTKRLALVAANAEYMDEVPLARPGKCGVYTRAANYTSWVKNCTSAPDSCQ